MLGVLGKPAFALVGRLTLTKTVSWLQVEFIATCDLIIVRGSDEQLWVFLLIKMKNYLIQEIDA